MLFAAVNVARKLRVDPELALRARRRRFRGRIEAAEALAPTPASDWADLPPTQQARLLRPSRLKRVTTT